MQKNHSTRKSTKTPATPVALPRHQGVVIAGQAVKNSTQPEVYPANVAGARQESRSIIYRDSVMESARVDSHDYYRDIDLGKLLGLSRPRDIRKTIARMVEREDIGSHQFITMDDGEGNQVFYLDKTASLKLAFRSNTGNAELVVMRVLEVVTGHADKVEVDSRAMDKHLAAIARTLVQIEKAKNPAVSAGLVSVLERYCRMAGVTMPDRALLISTEQPRLPGV